jgi:transposase-like protein
LNALSKSAHPEARAALKEVRGAEDKAHAERAIEQFANDYEAKWPKAAEKMAKDRDALLASYDFPQVHWVYLKANNPINFIFVSVRLRTKVTKEPGSRATGLAMASKFIESA